MSDQLTNLPIHHLQPNPFQPRSQLKKDDLAELVDSIKAHGILEPLVVAHTPAGYQIIAGERRWRAAKEAGLKEVPVVIKKTTPKGMLEMALVENIQRVDLEALERAQAFQQLMRDFTYSVTQIAQKIGKSASYVSNTLKLLQLPDAIKDGLMSGSITEGHARAISGIEDERAMIECYKIVLRENASVRRAEELSRRFKEASPNQVSDRGRPLTVTDEEVAQWQHKLQEIFHTRTNFKLVRSHRQTKIAITLRGTPEETQTDLERLLKAVDHATDQNP